MKWKTIDERIKKALSSEDQAFLSQMNANGSFYRDITAMFQGHMRWLNVLGLVDRDCPVCGCGGVRLAVCDADGLAAACSSGAWARSLRSLRSE